MAITFYGKWSLEVTGNVGEFQQRLRIVGSIANDGIVPGALGTQVAAIDGNGWNVFMERSNDGVNWFPNLVQRIPSVTLQNGLIITLFGDDSVVAPQDSDVTVRFVYLNAQVNPPPLQPPYNYIYTSNQLLPNLPPRPCPCCLRCPCACCDKREPERGRCC